jgi:hypothetical protein
LETIFPSFRSIIRNAATTLNFLKTQENYLITIWGIVMWNHSTAVGGVSAAGRGPADPRIVILMLCAAVALALAVPNIRNGVFDAMSTDDAMRLVEVNDLIAGQGWFDLMQYRLDPPGSLMHWSRVVDLPLAALILMFRPLAGVAGAEAIMLTLWPTLLFGAALVLVAAIAKRMNDGVDPRAVQLAAITLASLSVPSLIHFRAGAIDHHNFQIVLLLCFLFLTLDIERSRLSAGLAGLSATLSLAIGLEMLPAIATACVAILGLLIWRGNAVSRQVGAFGAALTGSSLLLAVLLLPSHSLGTPVCDAFGGPYLLLIAGGGISLMIVAGVDAWRPSMGARMASAAATGLILIGTFFKLFPECLASPYAAVDPLVASTWLDHVAETMSFQTVLLHAPQKIPGFYGFPVLTLLLAIAATIRAAPRSRFRMIAAVVTLAALIGISIWQVRGAAAATMLAAPIFAASLAALWPGHEQGRKLLLAVLVASPASFAATGLVAQPLIDRIVKPEWTIAEQSAASTCRTISSVAPLAVLARGRVMAPIDLGPAILAATEHSVFAAPYHRNNDGNLAMLQVMLAEPHRAQQILWDRRVDYIVMCTDGSEQMEFGKLAPNGLAARLSRGEIPDFLEPVGLEPSAGLIAWRVRRTHAAP